jgi:hypothetical protein
MPYKDKEKSREAYRKWLSRNKDKISEYRKILYKAKKANPIAQECVIEGCQSIGERHHPDYSKPEEIIWICREHHRRKMHAGKCSVCGDKIRARGLCNKHYKQERKRTEPEYAARVSRIRVAYRKKYGK